MFLDKESAEKVMISKIVFVFLYKAIVLVFLDKESVFVFPDKGNVYLYFLIKRVQQPGARPCHGSALTFLPLMERLLKPNVVQPTTIQIQISAQNVIQMQTQEQTLKNIAIAIASRQHCRLTIC